MIDPRPYAVGSIADTYTKYPSIGILLPAMGYGQEQMDDLQTNWQRYVGQPARDAGLHEPQLVVLQSPYRHLIGPLFRYITQLEQEHPDRQFAVIIPELVERHWYHYLLHNQRGEILKALLFLHGDRRIVIVNVPWYLSD